MKARSRYPEFSIPLVIVPSTISNNVPGTEFSLGCDTSINEIVSVSLLQHTFFYSQPLHGYMYALGGAYFENQRW